MRQFSKLSHLIRDNKITLWDINTGKINSTIEPLREVIEKIPKKFFFNDPLLVIVYDKSVVTYNLKVKVNNFKIDSAAKYVATKV